MAQTTINFRVDEELKNEFSNLCDRMGLSITSAFTAFMKMTINENGIPFQIKAKTLTQENVNKAFSNLELCDKEEIKEIELFQKADKFLEKHKGVKEKFEENIKNFLYGDKNINIKEMQGFKVPVYRMRIGAYRIIFTRRNGEIIVIYTVDAGNRGDIYNNTKDIKKSLKNKVKA